MLQGRLQAGSLDKRHWWTPAWNPARKTAGVPAGHSPLPGRLVYVPGKHRSDDLSRAENERGCWFSLHKYMHFPLWLKGKMPQNVVPVPLQVYMPTCDLVGLCCSTQVHWATTATTKQSKWA